MNTDKWWARFQKNFWKKIDVNGPDDCWQWKAARDTDGYGMVGVRGRVRGAHVVAYELAHGPVAKGLEVCHRCDNPGCCNERHFFVATHLQNMMDRDAKGRQARGQRNGNASLDDEKVIEIRARAARGEGTSSLARAYSVSRRNVYMIVRKETWQHVQQPVTTGEKRGHLRIPRTVGKPPMQQASFLDALQETSRPAGG